MNIQALIPKHKFDTVNIEHLKKLDPERISQISFHLLEWLADMNWPVAQSLVKVLPKFHKELVPDICYILSDEVDDKIWKYWILQSLVSQFPYESLILLKAHIVKLSNIQIEDEDDEDLKETATEILENHLRKGN